MKAKAHRPSEVPRRAKAVATAEAPATPPLPEPSEPERRAIALAKEKHEARTVRVRSGMVNQDSGPLMTNPHSDGSGLGNHGCGMRWVLAQKSF